MFSRIGERRGVKTSLFRMLMRIGASTFALDLLPAYARAGFRSPDALVALRPLRDIASGGERRGGVQTISENAPAVRHGHYAAWSQLGVGAGCVPPCAAFPDARTPPHDACARWSGRVPFIASGTIFAFGLHVRRSLPQTKSFARANGARRSPRRRGQHLRDKRMMLAAMRADRIDPVSYTHL